MDMKDYAHEIAMPLTQEHLDADKALRGLGKKFMVDYGFHNIFAKMREALATAPAPKRLM